MRLKTFVLAALATIGFAMPAAAQLSIVVDSTSNLSAIGVGESFTLDITLTTPVAEAQGLTIRVDGIDQAVLDFDTATLANASDPATPAGGGVFGALVELIPGFPLVYQNFIGNVLTGPVDNGTNVLLFDGVTTSPTTGTGPEVFTVTFDAIASGVVDLDIGAINAFGDAYVSTSGTTTPFTTVTVTVPEPGAMAASVAALGSVLGVVATRRRQDS